MKTHEEIRAFIEARRAELRLRPKLSDVEAMMENHNRTFYYPELLEVAEQLLAERERGNKCEHCGGEMGDTCDDCFDDLCRKTDEQLMINSRRITLKLKRVSELPLPQPPQQPSGSEANEETSA